MNWALKVRVIGVVVIFLWGAVGFAQNTGQTIRGNISDKITNARIAQVHIEIVGLSVGAISDDNGYFEILEVPFGRHNIRLTHASYEGQVLEVVVISGKESLVSVELSMGVLVLDEVSVKNNSFLLSGDIQGVRSINMEQTNRIPANFFDPVRLTTSFPGVIASNDQANTLVVRGNSPNSVLWRLEGLSIVNPNHTANAGTFSDLPVQAGGGVNILSGQMLGDSRFIPSPFEADLGNGFSAFDMRFRKGNDENWEFTGQASLVGLDIAAEGPFAGGSLIANYRYSTVGILTGPLGLDFGGEKINFSDLSFSYNRVSESGGELKVFGVGGASINQFTPSDLPEEWEFDKDSQYINYSGETGVIGATYKQPVGNDASINLSSAISSTLQKRKFYETDPIVLVGTLLREERYDLNRTILSNKINYQKRIKTGLFEIGGLFDNHVFNLNKESVPFSSSIYSEFNEISTWNIQPYVSLSSELGNSILVEGGIRYSLYTSNSTSNIEPRLAVTKFLANGSSLRGSYSKLSILPAIQNMLLNPQNADLDLIKSDVFNVSFETPFSEFYKLQIESYYQSTKNAPVDPNSDFNSLNGIDEYISSKLESTGEGRNYGVEVFIEKEMNNNSYYLGGFSLYQSEYLLGDLWTDTKFNGNYTVNFTYGRELNREKRGTVRVFNYSGRLLYLGGFRTADIDEQLSRDGITTVFDYKRGYNSQLNNYFRIDLSVSWRNNKPNSSRVIGLDIQNVLNQENESLRYFDSRSDKITTKFQLGMIPVLYYKIEF